MSRVAHSGQDGEISTVYKVSRPDVGNWVVKRIKKEFAALYMAEKSVLATLNHDFLPKIFDVFEDEHALYIAMEFINGVSLQQLIESTKIVTESQARKYLLQLCELFEYLHNNGVIHKDCKPSNIMLSDHGNVYLIDFGISKTPEQNPVGRTQMYASPEQLKHPDISDPRTDIYSLGATMFSLLTKETPAAGIVKLKNRTDISKKFKNIITKCVAKRPGSRYQSMSDVKKALLRKGWIWKVAACFVTMLALTVIVFFGLLTWNSEVNDRLLPRGYEMMRVSNYQVAGSHFERYIRRNPGAADGYMRHRELLVHRSFYSQSLNMFNQYEELHFTYFIDNSPEFRNIWIDAVGRAMQYYYDTEKWDELIDMLACARVRLVVPESLYLNTRMQIYMYTGDLETALRYYRQLQDMGEVASSDIYALILSKYMEDAHTYYNSRNFVEAADLVNTALEQYPNFSDNFDLLYIRAAAMLQHFFRERLHGREYASYHTRFVLYANAALGVVGEGDIFHAGNLQDSLDAMVMEGV